MFVKLKRCPFALQSIRHTTTPWCTLLDILVPRISYTRKTRCPPNKTFRFAGSSKDLRNRPETNGYRIDMHSRKRSLWARKTNKNLVPDKSPFRRPNIQRTTQCCRCLRLYCRTPFHIPRCPVLELEPPSVTWRTVQLNNFNTYFRRLT